MNGSQTGLVPEGLTFPRFAKAVALCCSLTAATLGQTPPTILSNNPATGAMNVPISAAVVFHFSTNMNTSLTRAQFINGSIPPPNTIAVASSWNTAGTQFTNAPVATLPAGKAIVWFMTGIDAWGRPLSGPLTGGFVTASLGSVALLSVSPTNQASNVSPAAPVKFTFNGAMDTNSTTAQFTESSEPAKPLAILKSWSADKTVLTCAPAPSFPAGKIIFWNVQGQGANGEALLGMGGGFTTQGMDEANPAMALILSRGESIEQTETNLFEGARHEFYALAEAPFSHNFAVAAPGQKTNLLSQSGGALKMLEFIEEIQGEAFLTDFPAGTYKLLLETTASNSTASINLTDGLAPPKARVLNWPARAVLGRPTGLNWALEGNETGADFVRIRVDQGGRLVYSTPMTGVSNALTGASTLALLPADIFTNAGRADLQITTFKVTSVDTNSIQGLKIHAARHSTTSVRLAVVDAATPPPILLTTNFPGIALDESFLHPLRAAHGARPLEFTLVSGSLPPGLQLLPEGALSGTSTDEGTFEARIQIRDVLGQVTIQPVRMVTVALPPAPSFALGKPVRAGPSKLRFEVTGPPSTDLQIHRSTNLVSWQQYLSTNSGSGALTIEGSTTNRAGFFRARPDAARPPPNPLTVSATLNSNNMTSATIGILGGSVSLTNTAGSIFTLNIPFGALDSDERIRLTEISRIGGLPLNGALDAAVDLQPSGLLFNEPVRLDIALPRGIDQGKVFGFGSMSDGSEFGLRYAFITNRTISLHLRHFSMAGSGSGSGEGGNSPGDPWDAMEQDLESMRRQCLTGDCNPETLRANLVKYLTQIADRDVLPNLRQAAKSGEDSEVDDALVTYLNWRKVAELLGLDESQLNTTVKAEAELASRLQRATGLSSTAISKSMDVACQDCLAHDIGRLQRMLDLERTAQLLGWTFDHKILKCYERCMVFELKLDSEIYVDTAAGTLLTHTQSTVKLEPLSDVNEWYLRRKASFSGQAEWKITSAVHFENKCAISKAPTSGSLKIPLATIFFFKQSTGKQTLDPHLELYIEAGLPLMPSEIRTMTCPDQPSQKLGDIYGPSFLALHNNEVVTPSGPAATLLPGPAVRVAGFQRSTSSDVLFTKEFNWSEGGATEFTTLELRHTPR